jgi:hypothetical protein
MTGKRHNRLHDPLSQAGRARNQGIIIVFGHWDYVQQQKVFLIQALYPAELRARPRGKSSYYKGNPPSTAPKKTPFFAPKKRVVCTGFAVHAVHPAFAGC